VLVDLVETVGGGHDCIVVWAVLVSFVQLPSFLVGWCFVRREGKQEG
jgi:hypothetical protein